MFCAKCGAVLADDARKCDKCGAPVRIRPNQSDRKGKGGKAVFSVPDEPGLPSPEDLENGLQQDLFMDPVFFQEADENLDVDAIIKIARGEDPGIKEPEPDSKPEPDSEPEPELDMETYLQSLPMIEKLRRRIQSRHHTREEAADAKRMKEHLERASKHFSEAENAALQAEEKRLEAARLKREKARAEAERIRMKQEEAARQQEEKLRMEKAEAESSRVEKEEIRKAEAETAEAAKAEEARAEAARIQEETARIQEEEIRRREEQVRGERIAAAARQRERAREAAARRQEVKEQTESTDHQEREGLEVIRLQKAAATREEQRAADERAAEEALRQEAMLAEQAALRREDEKRAEAQRAQAEQTIRLQEEKSSVQKKLHGVLHDSDSFKTLDEHGRKDLTAAEREMEVLRRKRKYRNNQPDRFDEYLGRYGLTKEIAVRIATLFLIVLLSVIYVMGRGSKNTPAPAPVNAGNAATGFESAEEQPDDGTGTEPSEDTEEMEVPTGGGDFESN